MPGIAWVEVGVWLFEFCFFYRLESVSEGRPISCGSNSISESPVLLVRVVYIMGFNINCLNLFIDHELSCGSGLSRNISSLIVRRAGQAVMK